MSEFTLQELLPGVQVAFGGVCNRGIISDQGQVLVVDSGIGLPEASPLRDAAQTHLKNGPVMLFNTHPHPDHVLGNGLFTDGLIVGQKNVREEMLTTVVQALAAFSQDPQRAAMVGGATIAPPTLTFEDRLTIFVGDIEVQLLHFGSAHSASDSVAWLPQTRTLFAGDLLFNGIVPVLPPVSNVSHWIEVLEQLEALDAQHVIPGHGPIQAPDALARLRQWLIEVRSRVSAAIEQGWDGDSSAERITAEMHTLEPRGNESRLPGLVQQVYTQLSK
ncbi:MBL fold metallo-hydrolase [Dictyobacter arantiisoli]|uniref:Metallo-beta-lactamase domain-containing protein n=1 Tax=Dictyobacter arantiisoli TaxID=2014874 RepID=A0A5A5TKF2_9CHLR|nr:MBL fold metallo-hydrolase [Dictyobacter arantiisoli]GCF11927.1 hypothetical protein KDI_54910 [Dictyobacter arantiisoli]